MINNNNINIFNNEGLSSNISPKNIKDNNLIKKTDKVTKIIIVMRHGERIDNTKESNKQLNEKYDPELSKNGINQAKSIGKQILKRIDLENFNEINIFSSPFTRTIMTSIFVLYEIIKSYNKDININLYKILDLSEFCSINNFSYSPINSLLIYNEKNNMKNYEHFITENIKKLNKKFNDLKFKSLPFEMKSISYPEDFNTMFDRYKGIGNKLYNNIIENNNNNSINIIVTHGYGVQIITDNIFDKIEKLNMNKNENFQKDDIFADYCSSFCFNVFKNLEETNKTNIEIKYVGEMNPLIFK